MNLVEADAKRPPLPAELLPLAYAPRALQSLQRTMTDRGVWYSEALPQGWTAMNVLFRLIVGFPMAMMCIGGFVFAIASMPDKPGEALASLLWALLLASGIYGLLHSSGRHRQSSPVGLLIQPPVISFSASFGPATSGAWHATQIARLEIRPRLITPERTMGDLMLLPRAGREVCLLRFRPITDLQLVVDEATAMLGLAKILP